MKKCRAAVGFVALLIQLIGGAIAFAATPDPERIVVLMSVDGLANFYMNDPAANMPTIHQLAREGAVAAGMRASDPTVTWPNHTTLVTGVPPARHGVVGNNYFDRLTGEKVQLIWDPLFDKDQIVKVPTVYDAAKAAGLKTAAVHWPATRNAPTLDWTTPDVAKDELVRTCTTPALMADCKEAGLKIDDADQLKDRSVQDPIFVRLFNLILRKYRPNLALLHVVHVDHVEHQFGPRSAEAYAAIKTADDEVRQVWDEIERSFPGKATLIIVSDHGFSPLEKKISTNLVLQQAGLVETAGRRVTGGAVQVLAQGGSALVYVLDDVDRAATMERVKKTFASVDGIAKIIDSDDFAEYGIADPKRDPHAPDLVLFAKLGYYFGDTSARAVPISAKPELKGGHGYDSHLPELHAVFIACGAGIKPGARLGEIDNKSVAPTIARLLKIDLPGTESKPLVDALSE